jgi:hypothetical protein
MLNSNDFEFQERCLQIGGFLFKREFVRIGIYSKILYAMVISIDDSEQF